MVTPDRVGLGSEAILDQDDREKAAMDCLDVHLQDDHTPDQLAVCPDQTPDQLVCLVRPEARFQEAIESAALPNREVLEVLDRADREVLEVLDQDALHLEVSVNLDQDVHQSRRRLVKEARYNTRFTILTRAIFILRLDKAGAPLSIWFVQRLVWLSTRDKSRLE